MKWGLLTETLNHKISSFPIKPIKFVILDGQPFATIAGGPAVEPLTTLLLRSYKEVSTTWQLTIGGLE